MSQQDRLEALLTRVQENRRKPRLAVVDSSTARASTAVGGMGTTEAVAAAPLAATPPLSATQSASVSATQSGYAAPDSTAPAASAQPAVERPLQPERVELPTMQAAGSVAVVTTQGPSIRELTFGELLARSLSLRPR